MDKEREMVLESGFSEKQLDQNTDKTAQNDQVKAATISGNIFVNLKKKIKSQSSKTQE